MILFPVKISSIRWQVDCFSASLRLATPASVIWLSFRWSRVSWQVDCFSASLRLATPASLIWLLPRSSVVSWQVDSFSASPRLAAPVLVIWLPQRLSIVIWEVDCFNASLRLAAPTSVIWLLPKLSKVNGMVDCLRALLRLEAPASVIWLPPRQRVNGLVNTIPQMHCMRSSFRPQCVSPRSPEKPVACNCKKRQIRPTLKGVSTDQWKLRPRRQLVGSDGCCWFDWDVSSSLSELKMSSKNKKSVMSTPFLQDNFNSL